MPKSALDILGSSLSRKRGKRTAFDALGKAFKRRGRRGKGIAGQADYHSRRGRRKGGMVGALSLGDRVMGKSKRKRRDKQWDKIALLAARAMSDRPTKGEYEQAKVEIDRAVQADPQLQATKDDASLTQGNTRATFIQRLMLIARARFSRWIN